MPGGLQGVEQSFTADASGYLSAIRQMIEGNRGLVSSVRDTMSQVADAQAALRGAGSGTGIAGNPADLARQNQAIRETLASLKEYRTAVSDSGAAAAAAAAGYETMRASVAEVGDAHTGAATQIRGTTSALQAHSETVADTFRSYGLLDQAVSRQRETARSYGQQMDALRAQLQGGADAGTVFREALQIRNADVASLGTVRDTARSATSALADTAAAVTAVKSAAGGGSSGGSATANILGDALAARFLAGSQAAATSSPWAPSAAVLAAMAARSGGGGGGTFGGGGGGGFPGGAGGGGGGGGGAGGFVPWAGGGWPAVRFWGMAAAEVASTVIPAMVAAGAAGLVGLQGGQQLYNRYGAINAAAGSIGGAYGQTAGSFLGIGSGLQNAQNAAGGGVYELAGAGINMLRSGAGSGLLQQGTNTIAMLDRAAANVSPNFGARIAALMGGGTGYLQQFGSVGANLGNTLLNIAPNLPGVGADLLSTLQGATGGAAALTGSVPGPLLKSLLTYEAASRWGPALLGGQGLIGRALGLGGVGGLGGLLGKGGEALAARGLGGTLGDVGLGMIGAGDTLAALTGPGIGLPLALAQLEFAALNRLPQGAAGQAASTIAGLQGGIATAGFSGAWQPLAHAVTQVTGLAEAASGPGAMQAPTRQMMFSKEGLALREAYAQSPGQQYDRAAQGFIQSMTDLQRAGPQLVAVLDKAGLKGTSMADAFQIAQNALLDIPHAFGKDGKLTQTAKQMVTNYVAAIGPMTQNAGAFGAAVGSQTIMGSGAMKNLSTVNSALDSMTQIMSGTPLGASGLAATIGGITNPKALAQGLASVTSPGSGAAWNTFASTSTAAPGIITQLQSFNDQMRTGLTLGATTPGQAAGMTGYEIQQTLKKTPGLKSDPAALAMLMQQAAQQGIGGYYQGGAGNAQANYAALEKSLSKSADSVQRMNADSTAMTIHLADIPKVAQQFSQSMNAGVMSQRVADAATAMVTLQNSVKGTSFNTGALSAWVSDLQKAGVSAQAIGPMMKNALQSAGIGGAAQRAIMLKVNADTAAAQAKINSVQGKTVNVTALAPTGAVTAMQAAINAVRGKTVTINVDQVYTVHTTAGAPGGGYVTAPGLGLTPYTPAGAAANLLPAAYTKPVAMTSATNPYAGGISGRAQTGMKIPGYGGGDIFPLMAEPGELVVPKHMVAAGMVDHLRGTIPGFAAGGVTGGMGGGRAGVVPIPAVAQRALDALLSEMAKSGAWKQAGVNIVNGITYSLSGTGADASKVGKALVAHSAADAKSLAGTFTTAMNYARSTAAATTSGLNLAGMNVTPGTGGGTIQEQMQSYLGSVTSFTKDLGALSKDGLSKSLAQQIIAAGPVQGDALAQSALNGYGGVGSVNKLWGQIGKASNALGAQAGMSVYGAHLSPGLTGGTVTNNSITVNVTAPGGAGSDVNLTAAQIKTLTEMIQAKLLQQARRNPKTGVKLAGKSA